LSGIQFVGQHVTIHSFNIAKSLNGFYHIQLFQCLQRQFAELIDLDVEVADMLYSAYALDQSDYGALVSGSSAAMVSSPS